MAPVPDPRSKIEVSLEECADFGPRPPLEKSLLRSAVRCHFSAQARQALTNSSQNSSSGAVFETWALTFVHRRGGFGAFAKNVEFITFFEKPCKIIAPAVENAPPRELSNCQCNLTVPAAKVGRPHADSPLFLRAEAFARRQPRAKAFARGAPRGYLCAETPARRATHARRHPRAEAFARRRLHAEAFSRPLRGRVCYSTVAVEKIWAVDGIECALSPCVRALQTHFLKGLTGQFWPTKKREGCVEH